MKYKCAD